MKRIFWILALCLAVTFRAFSQEEADDFFDDEEPPSESDFEYQPPPNVPVGNPDDPVSTLPAPPPGSGGPGPRPRFSRPFPSGNNNNFGPSPSVGMNPDGSFEFKLVDPPAFKEKKSRINVPPAIRSKVDAKVRAAEQLRGGE